MHGNLNLQHQETISSCTDSTALGIQFPLKHMGLEEAFNVLSFLIISAKATSNQATEPGAEAISDND